MKAAASAAQTFTLPWTAPYLVPFLNVSNWLKLKLKRLRS